MTQLIKRASGILAIVCLTSFSAVPANTDTKQQLRNVELDYLKELHLKSSQVDPVITAQLVGTFVVTNRAKEGATFFSSQRTSVNNISPGLSLAAEAALRANSAQEVFLLKRNRWVKDTVLMFDKARDTATDNLLVRWLTGTTLAQIPQKFGQQEKALTDLHWLVDNFDKLPADGLQRGAEREVFYQLACLYRDLGEEDKSQSYLLHSGYKSFQRTSPVISQFAASAENGLTMYPSHVSEVIPGKIFAATGFEMTEYYFIVSEDGSETISIDAGTRPSAAKKAHEAVLAIFPSLPPVKTVLVTHTHWDHVGGHQYFRTLNPDVQFISSANFEEELAVVRRSEPSFKFFFSNEYSKDNVANYYPDSTIAENTSLNIGGTEILAIPIAGGETHDGLFFHLPAYKITFVGDFIMPYLGAPFANEGSASGLLETIDLLASLDSDLQLHGHKPLTDFFSPIPTLVKLKGALTELQQHIGQGRALGLSLAQIIQTNFIPEMVFENPDMQLPYKVIRNGFINRWHKEASGYWQSNLDGMDYLSHADFGTILTEYLEISESKLHDAMTNLINDGHFDAALKLSSWTQTQHPESAKLLDMRQKALVGLRSKYQFSNPFKFLIYSEVLGESVPQLSYPPLGELAK